jgi:hypothetical protein
MVRKIFIDSRFRDSGSFANFQYSLKTPVTHPKCRAYIDQLHIPNVFPTIHENNRNLYIVESYSDDGVLYHVRKRKVPLTVGNYDIDSLATELQTQLNANTYFPDNQYVVTKDESLGKLTIGFSGSGNAEVNIWTMPYLKKHRDLWVDPSSNQVGTFVEDDDCYSVIGFTEEAPMTASHSFSLQGNAHISTLPFHTVYLTCSYGLGTNEDAIGPRGGNSILRSIVVNTSFGNMIHDMLQNPFDYTTLEAGQLTSFGFALRDIYGRDLPLNQSFSFSIMLVEEE